MFIKNIFKTYSGLPGSVYVIFFARVINCIGNFVFPFLTLLLTTKIGMSEDKVGLFLLLGASTQVPAMLIGGKITDHFGRKKIMITFMTLASLCFIPCAFLISSPESMNLVPWFLIISLFLGGIAGPSAGAMINDLTEPQNRQAAFSLLYLGVNLGAAVGYLFAGFLFNNLIILLFLGDTATTMIAVILLALMVKETKPKIEDIEKVADDRPGEKAEKGGLFSALLKRPALLVFVGVCTIFSFAYSQTHFSLPLQAEKIFGGDLGSLYYGTLCTVNCLVVIIFTSIITAITKKIKAIYNVAIAGAFFAVGFGMIYFVNSLWMFALSTIIWTIGEILNATNVGVYIANNTPVSHRGRFSSVIGLISGTGGAIAPSIMGSFIVVYGVRNVWPVIFVLDVVASTLMLIIGTVTDRRKSPSLGVKEVGC